MSSYSNQLQSALQNLLQCVVWFFQPEIVMSDDAYIGGRSENNIKCVVHDDLWWKNRTTRYILPRHWLYEWFSQCHRCGTYSVLSRSPSIVNKWMLAVSVVCDDGRHWFGRCKLCATISCTTALSCITVDSTWLTTACAPSSAQNFPPSFDTGISTAAKLPSIMCTNLQPASLDAWPDLHSSSLSDELFSNRKSVHHSPMRV